MKPEDIQIFDKLVEEKLKSADLHEFDGQNCNDYMDYDSEPCPGWDGQSRRCECGNRRVVWTLSDCKTYVYGEAW